MIEVKNVVKRFDGFTALDGASLSVPTGSVYGLVGPNGAGKSTIIRHLTGIYRQDEGTVAIGGEDVWENAGLKARVAAIPDDWYYFLQSTVRDMMRFYKGFYPRFSMERYEKLPSVRALAAQLAINPNTIQRAYNELEGEGYIYSVPGKGSFAAGNTGADAQRRTELLAQVRELAAELHYLGVSRRELETLIKEAYES